MLLTSSLPVWLTDAPTRKIADRAQARCSCWRNLFVLCTYRNLFPGCSTYHHLANAMDVCLPMEKMRAPCCWGYLLGLFEDMTCFSALHLANKVARTSCKLQVTKDLISRLPLCQLRTHFVDSCATSVDRPGLMPEVGSLGALTDAAQVYDETVPCARHMTLPNKKDVLAATTAFPKTPELRVSCVGRLHVELSW